LEKGTAGEKRGARYSLSLGKKRGKRGAIVKMPSKSSQKTAVAPVKEKVLAGVRKRGKSK